MAKVTKFCSLLHSTCSSRKHLRRRMGQTEASQDEEEPPVPAKTPRLFSGYHKKSSKKNADHRTSCKDEVIHYIQVCSEEELECMDFWQKHAKVFPRLYRVSMKLLAVPATSSPVERVFSHGGLMMRPHRASQTLSSLSLLLKTFLVLRPLKDT